MHGNRIICEKGAEEGARYLEERLDSEYAKVFFVYARHYGTAPFEDQQGRKYSLVYENELYILNRK